MPRHLRMEVVAREQAQRRAAEERRLRAREADQRRRREAAERHERERDAERRLLEEMRRARQRQEHERVMDERYRVCFREAYKAIGSPTGPRWTELPEAVQLRRDFPHARPAWWEPPPGLFEAVEAELSKRKVYGCREPDWSRWAPPYVPGRLGPWRKSGAKGDAVPA